MISNNLVPERESVPIVIHDHTLLHVISFLCISEGTKVPIQVSLLSIFLIGIIKIPRHTLLHSMRLLINVSKSPPQCLIKTTPLLCHAYSTSPLLWWGTLKCTLIFIIFVVINEVQHLWYCGYQPR